MTMKIPSWKTITAGVATASLAIAIGAPLAQAASPAKRGKVKTKTKIISGADLRSASRLSAASRHLTKGEKANLAVVLDAYHMAEGNVLDLPGFINSFTKDGVFNDVVAGDTYQGKQLGDVLTRMANLLPDVHRELYRITVSGDVVTVELSIQGTFKGPLETPAGTVKPTGAKVDVPTADFWYLRNGKVETFNCYVGYSVMFAQMGVNPDWASAVAAG